MHELSIVIDLGSEVHLFIRSSRSPAATKSDEAEVRSRDLSKEIMFSKSCSRTACRACCVQVRSPSDSQAAQQQPKPAVEAQLRLRDHNAQAFPRAKMPQKIDGF